MCFEREDINGELPQVTRAGQWIEIAFMLKERAFRAALAKLCAEE